MLQDHPTCTRSLPPDTAPSLLTAASVEGRICTLVRVKLLTLCPRQASTGWHVTGYWCAFAETEFESTPRLPALLRCHSEGRVPGNANPTEPLICLQHIASLASALSGGHMVQGGQAPSFRSPSRLVSASASVEECWRAECLPRPSVPRRDLHFDYF